VFERHRGGGRPASSAYLLALFIFELLTDFNWQKVTGPPMKNDTRFDYKEGRKRGTTISKCCWLSCPKMPQL
jgi:hypothetical protein